MKDKMKCSNPHDANNIKGIQMRDTSSEFAFDNFQEIKQIIATELSMELAQEYQSNGLMYPEKGWKEGIT